MDKNLEQYQRKAEILKALGHPVRLCIVTGLIDTHGCNVTHIQDCIGLPQSTISQHIQKLKSAGIIEGKRTGTEITYVVSDDLTKQIIKLITIGEEI
ncbi:MAG: metalloregulator ArsR/SmtB family transcription factor [Clostridiaceae bacterium]